MSKTIIALAAVAAFAVAGQAAAHARLIVSSPKVGATIAAPKEIRLQYSETIVPAASSVAVSGPNGAAVAAGPIALDAKDKRVVVVPVTGAMSAGPNTVTWHMKTEDGHETDGKFVFVVK